MSPRYNSSQKLMVSGLYFFHKYLCIFLFSCICPLDILLVLASILLRAAIEWCEDVRQKWKNKSILCLTTYPWLSCFFHQVNSLFNLYSFMIRTKFYDMLPHIAEAFKRPLEILKVCRQISKFSSSHERKGLHITTSHFHFLSLDSKPQTQKTIFNV